METHLLPRLDGRNLADVENHEPKPGKLVEQPCARQSRRRVLNIASLQLPGQLSQHFVAGTRRDVTTHDVVFGEIISLPPRVQHRVVVGNLDPAVRIARHEPLIFQLSDDTAGKAFVQAARFGQFALDERVVRFSSTTIAQSLRSWARTGCADDRGV